VEPPNYNFSVDELSKFYPGKKLEELLKEYPNSKIQSNNGGAIIRKFYVTHKQYKFPVLVQARAGVILDFYARLPAYFLHDVFHQSLINRYGKQNKYKKVEESAVYIWTKRSDFKIIYSGGCSITCYPVFLSIIGKAATVSGGFTPIIETMN
jgi:hypothetical protein